MSKLSNSTHEIYACTLEEIQIRAAEIENKFKAENPTIEYELSIYPKPKMVEFDGFACHKFEVDIIEKHSK